MTKKEKCNGITLNVDDEPYYGISIYVWGSKDGDNRKEFIKKMNKAIHDNWIVKNVDIADWVDFIITLSNNLNGDDLYTNVVNNFLYIEELSEKAYELGISINCIYKNRHSYNDSETISIYNELAFCYSAMNNMEIDTVRTKLGERA